MTHDEIAQLDAAQLRLEVARVKGEAVWILFRRCIAVSRLPPISVIQPSAN